MTRAEHRIRLAPKLVPVFQGKARYRGAYGGRGSSKSYAFADMALVRALTRKQRILCARELQNSIRDSVHELLIERIKANGLEDYFSWGESYLRARTGSEFVYRGLRHNVEEIKSMQGLGLAWLEEAESLSDRSWRTLAPTVRAAGSEIWATWNPVSADSPTHKRLRESPPEGARIAEINWQDNPWFPAELDEERRRDQRLDPALYAHVWGGAFYEQSDAQVLKGKWSVGEFVPGPDWDGPYHGLDWGFSRDPTCAVRCWLHGGALYIEYDPGKAGLELDDTASWLEERLPDLGRHVIRADSARPESIAHVKRRGLPRIEAVKKWPGSVEDGIAYLRSFERIVIHPRCEEAQREARLWSYKVDRKSGDVLPTLVDGNDHRWDAVRYALAPLIRERKAQPRVRRL